MSDTTERTFSQAEVDNIVRDRLAKERGKIDATLSAEREALARREFLLDAREAVVRAGLPANFADVLDTSSPEAFQNALNTVAATLGQKRNAIPPRGGFSGGISQPPPPDPIREGMGLQRKDE